MKRTPWSWFFGGLLVGLISTGCAPFADRSMVIMAPRQPRVRVKPGVRVKARQSVAQKPPAMIPVPPARGVDVPAIGPD